MCILLSDVSSVAFSAKRKQWTDYLIDIMVRN